VIGWAESWNGSQGFWTAVQGVGTFLAALAALVALIIARSQLAELIRSNKLLASSNDAMTHSNVALTRPYVVVDFEFRPSVGRDGNLLGTTIAVLIENAGRTPAKNLRLKVNPPFPLPDDPKNPGWSKAVEELNKAMNGETVIKSLTRVRPLSFYLDEAKDIMGSDEKAAGSWEVSATYEDAEGHTFSEVSVLELSHWRLGLVTVDPAYRIAKGVQAVAYEVKNKKLPSLDFESPPAPRNKIGRPATRRVTKRGR
jgi:hypothetical protein